LGIKTEYEPFETFARLYLEEKGYVTSTNIKLPPELGGGDIDIFAHHPHRGTAVIGFCVTTTHGIPRGLRKQMIKQREFVYRSYPSLRGKLEFWYFTLWMGKREESKRSRLKRLGFKKVVGRREFRGFLYDLIRNYRSWEKKRKSGPREIEPIRWTVKTLCRLGLLRKSRKRRKRSRMSANTYCAKQE